MKLRNLLILVVAALAGVVALGYLLPGEPYWKGRPLSAWIEAFDTNLRFPDDGPLRSGFSDEEIEQALEGIGPRALPSLLEWTKAKPGHLGDRLNALLDRERWIRFRFVSVARRHSWAGTGFQAYSSAASDSA
jgi:hypothetical protein